MRRDTIFYQLFRQAPTLLFELLPEMPERSAEYIFDSIEVKETSFRIDGVFLPPDPSGVVFFCELQFQPDQLLYERLVSEISIYAYRQRNLFSDWRAVAIYPSRSLEQSNKQIVAEMLASGRIVPIYLDELPREDDLPIGLGLLLLTTLEGDEAKTEARRLIGRASENRDIIALVSTIVLYKFNSLSRDEVDMMLGIELQQTRVYQEAKAEGKAEGESIGLERGRAEGKAEGRAEGEQSLVLKQLTRKIGRINNRIESQISELSIEQVESLGEALLDFTQMDDLMAWLERDK